MDSAASAMGRRGRRSGRISNPERTYSNWQTTVTRAASCVTKDRRHTPPLKDDPGLRKCARDVAAHAVLALSYDYGEVGEVLGHLAVAGHGAASRTHVEPFTSPSGANGLSRDSSLVRWFWNVMDGFSQEERTRLICCSWMGAEGQILQRPRGAPTRSLRGQGATRSSTILRGWSLRRSNPLHSDVVGEIR